MSDDNKKPDYDGMIAVIQSHKDGGAIEYREKDVQQRGVNGRDGWIQLYYYFDFDFHKYDYRVKPEPQKPREWWISECKDATPHTRVYESARLVLCQHCRVTHVREVLEVPSVEPKETKSDSASE